MYSSTIVNPVSFGYETGYEITRELPLARDPEELSARQVFESYGADIQSMRIKTGMAAVTGALAGSKAGIPGIVIGAALGALAAYWKGKAYRTRVYAELDAMGLLRKPRIKYRGSTYLRNQDFVFLRYPYAETTALVIVPILQKHYPDLTVQELTEIGQNAQRALIKFRQANQDVPLSLAAEVILAYYGVMRNAQGVYDLAYEPEPDSHYQPPPPGHIPSIPTKPTPKPAHDPGTSQVYWWIAAAMIGAALILRK